MRQVPHYLLIGDGRLARHFQYYFNSLAIPYSTWSRKKNSESVLKKFLQTTTHVLLCIRDDAIDDFVHQYHDTTLSLQWIHFSGSLVSPIAHSAHPLQVFGETLYLPDAYRAIPFVIETEGPCFPELLPGLPNVFYKISRTQKAYYHAQCVMANNFTTLLWQHFFSSLTQQLQMDEKHLQPFLRQTFLNLECNSSTALSGPLARQDVQTLLRDVAALQNDKHQAIFKSFLHTYFPEVI